MSNISTMLIDINNSKEYLAYNKYHAGNPFGITGTSRLELMHSNYIAWILDPKSSHLMGTFPIIHFMQMIAVVKGNSCNINSRLDKDIEKLLLSGNFDVTEVQVSREVTFTTVGPTKKEKRSIDILIEIKLNGRILPIVIENKVNSKEHKDQTKDYYDWAEEKYDDKTIYWQPIYVFLTPAYNTAGCKCPYYINIKYQDLVDRVLEPCMWACTNPSTIDNIRNYLQCLSFQSDNKKGENTMAISSEERKLLQDFFDKNKNLLCAFAEMLDDEETELKRKFSEAVRDYTQYEFNGNTFGKGKLVLAVIKQYVAYKDPTFSDLQKEFPKELQGSLDVVKKDLDLKGDKRKRYYTNSDDEISLTDGTLIAVCSQWGIKNIGNFIEKAEELGYSITSL